MAFRWPSIVEGATRATKAFFEEIKSALSEVETDVNELTFDVSQYGAVGNGTTNDTTACQEAITACGNAGGGIVFFPPGRYLVSKPLAMATSVRLVGAGPQTTTLVGAASFPHAEPSGLVQFGSAVYTTTGPTLLGCAVKSLGFDMTKVNDETVNRVNAVYQDYSEIQDVLIEDVYYTGLKNGCCILFNGLGRGVAEPNSHGITIRDIYAINGAGTIALYFNAASASASYGGVFIENIYNSVTITGIEDDRVAIAGNFPLGSSGSQAYMQGFTVRDVFVDIAAGSSGLVNGVKVDTGAFCQVQNVQVSGVHFRAQATGGANGHPVIMYGEEYGFLQDVLVENVQALNSESITLFFSRFSVAGAPSIVLRNVQLENCRDTACLIKFYTATPAEPVKDEHVIIENVAGSSGAAESTYGPVGILLCSGTATQGCAGLVKLDNIVFGPEAKLKYGIASTLNSTATGTAMTLYNNIHVGDVNLEGCTTPLSFTAGTSMVGFYGVASSSRPEVTGSTVTAKQLAEALAKTGLIKVN